MHSGELSFKPQDFFFNPCVTCLFFCLSFQMLKKDNNNMSPLFSFINLFYTIYNKNANFMSMSMKADKMRMYNIFLWPFFLTQTFLDHSVSLVQSKSEKFYSCSNSEIECVFKCILSSFQNDAQPSHTHDSVSLQLHAE